MRGEVDAIAQVLSERFLLSVPPRSDRTVTLFTVPRARVKTVETAGWNVLRARRNWNVLRAREGHERFSG